jgi:hypothetical protein
MSVKRITGFESYVDAGMLLDIMNEVSEALGVSIEYGQLDRHVAAENVRLIQSGLPVSTVLFDDGSVYGYGPERAMTIGFEDDGAYYFFPSVVSKYTYGYTDGKTFWGYTDIPKLMSLRLNTTDTYTVVPFQPLAAVYNGLQVQCGNAEPAPITDVSQIKSILVKMLISLLENVKASDVHGESQFIKLRTAVMKEHSEALSSKVRTLEREIDELVYSMRSKTNEMSFSKVILESLTVEDSSILLDKFKEEYATLERFTKTRAVTSMSVINGELVFETGTVNLSDPNSGLETVVGPFEAHVNLSSGRLESVIGVSNAVMVGSYCHPHVASNGNPCLGDADSQIRTAVGTGDYTSIVTAVLNYLSSYNYKSVYVKIEEFRRQYLAKVRRDAEAAGEAIPEFAQEEVEDSEGDDYDGCYEDNFGTSECVTCVDSDCPYHHDERERACFDNICDGGDWARCITCRSCNYCSDAENRCHDDCVMSTDCMSRCEVRDCAYYRDEGYCFAVYEGERGADVHCLLNCTTDACRNYRRFELCGNYDSAEENLEACEGCEVTVCPKYPGRATASTDVQEQENPSVEAEAGCALEQPRVTQYDDDGNVVQAPTSRCAGCHLRTSCANSGEEA